MTSFYSQTEAIIDMEKKYGFQKYSNEFNCIKYFYCFLEI